eukprot:TRINITY_DN10135_c1_g1_i1.p1 TRINITY_DN10135_c1_g1~~TRINITY_DN10135_c1_g1_i1.p1  ORF type:complete len:2452 (+),score=920.52 TRINITY_DN10135_c1_g1_i1:63-7418(+)
MGKGRNEPCLHVAWELGPPEDITAPLGHSARQDLQRKLRAMGAKGSSLVSDKTNFLLTRNCAPDQWQRSYTLKKAVALGIPIVNVTMLDNWCEGLKVEDLLEIFKINAPQGVNNLAAVKSDAAPWWEQLGSDNTGTDWDTPQSAPWVQLTEGSDATAEENYIIPAYQGFANGGWGAKGVACAEVHSVFAGKKLEGGGSGGGAAARLPQDTVQYRVFLQVGAKRALSATTASSEKAEELFDFVWRLLLGDGFVTTARVGTLHMLDGCEVRVGNISRFRENFYFGRDANCSAVSRGVPRDILQLASQAFGELQRHLGEAMGGFQNVFAVSLQDVLDAEALLRVLTDTVAEYHASAPKLQRNLESQMEALMRDYRSASKMRRVSFADDEGDFLPEGCRVDVDHEQFKLQQLKTCLACGEFMGTGSVEPQQTPLLWQYLALNCEVNQVRGERAARVQKKCLQGAELHPDIFQIDSIFELRKPEEHFNYASEVGNHRMLLHCTPAHNVASILANGLQVPRAQRMRRDRGMLGRGIYFAHDLSTCMRYATESEQGYIFVFACEVALGKMSSTTQPTHGSTGPPAGFDSLHGRKDDSDSPSAFRDDEYCIYRAEQQRLKYMFRIKVLDTAAADAFFQATYGTPLLSARQQGRYGPSTSLPREVALSSVSSMNNEAAAPQVVPELEVSVESLDAVGLVFETNGQEVPALLKKISVKGTLLDLVGEVVIFQHYRNDYSQSVQGKYVFPLQEKAAVCGFEAFINDKHVVAVTKEKEQAQREYKEAVKAGKGAYLLEDSSKETPEIFTISIGNLPPKTDVVIKLTYITELTVDTAAGCVRWVLPREVHPRRAAQDQDEQDDSEEDVGDVVVSRQGDMEAFDLELGVTMPWDVVRIDVSHEYLTKRSAHCASVRVCGGIEGAEGVTTPLDDLFERDFVLEVYLENIAAPRMWVERMQGDDRQKSDDKAACMVCFSPEAPDAAQLAAQPAAAGEGRRRKEVLIVIDTSVSMSQGHGIEAALQGAQLCLRELEDREHSGLLPYETYFNVLTFGLRTNRLFARAVPLNESNATVAHDYLEGQCRVNGGGTDLFTVLRDLVSLQRNDMSLLVFSDGAIDFGSQVADCASLLHGGLSQCPGLSHAISHLREGFSERMFRVFTFGVGDQVCSHPLRVVAAHGRGEYAALPGDRKSRWADVVKRQLAKLDGNVLTDIRVDWSDERSQALKQEFAAGVQQTPAFIPSLFSQSQSVMFCLASRAPRRVEMLAVSKSQNPKYTPASAQPEEMTAETLFHEEEPLVLQQEERYLVTPWPSHHIQGDILHKLCVRNIIREFEGGAFSADYATHVARKRQMKDTMVALGIQFNLVTRFTSMLAVEERSDEEKRRLRHGKGQCNTPGVDTLAHMLHVDPLPEQVYRSSRTIAREALEERQLMQRLQLGTQNAEKQARREAKRMQRQAARAVRREKAASRKSGDPLDDAVRQLGLMPFMSRVFQTPRHARAEVDKAEEEVGYPNVEHQLAKMSWCYSHEEAEMSSVCVAESAVCAAADYAVEDESDDEDGGGFGLFDSSSDERAPSAQRRSSITHKARAAPPPPPEEEEDGEEDMGFGLFDSFCDPAPSASAAPVPSLGRQAMKAKGGHDEVWEVDDRSLFDSPCALAAPPPSAAPRSYPKRGKNEKKEKKECRKPAPVEMINDALDDVFGAEDEECADDLMMLGLFDDAGAAPPVVEATSRRRSMEEEEKKRVEPVARETRKSDKKKKSKQRDVAHATASTLLSASVMRDFAGQVKTAGQPFMASKAPPPPPARAAMPAMASAPHHHAKERRSKKLVQKKDNAEKEEEQEWCKDEMQTFSLTSLCTGAAQEQRGGGGGGFGGGGGRGRGGAFKSTKGFAASVGKALTPTSEGGILLGINCWCPMRSLKDHLGSSTANITLGGVPRHLTRGYLADHLGLFGELFELRTGRLLDEGIVEVTLGSPEHDEYLAWAVRQGGENGVVSFLTECNVSLPPFSKEVAPVPNDATDYIIGLRVAAESAGSCIQSWRGSGTPTTPNTSCLLSECRTPAALLSYLTDHGLTGGDLRYANHLLLGCIVAVAEFLMRLYKLTSPAHFLEAQEVRDACASLLQEHGDSSGLIPATWHLGSDWVEAGGHFLKHITASDAEHCVYNADTCLINVRNMRKVRTSNEHAIATLEAEPETHTTAYTVEDVYSGAALRDTVLACSDSAAEAELSRILEAAHLRDDLYSAYPETHDVDVSLWADPGCEHPCFRPVFALEGVASGSLVLTTREDYQTSVGVSLAVSLGAEDAVQNLYSCSIDVPPRVAGEVRLACTLELQEDGSLHLTAQNDTHGIDTSVVVNAAKIRGATSTLTQAKKPRRSMHLRMRRDFLQELEYLRMGVHAMRRDLAFHPGDDVRDAAPRSYREQVMIDEYHNALQYITSATPLHHHDITIDHLEELRRVSQSFLSICSPCIEA